MKLKSVLLCILFLAALPLPLSGSERKYNPDELSAGLTLYQNNCAVCHGPAAEGLTADWKQRDANGNIPPPPLNGTAHTWHHPLKALFRTVREGNVAIGGTMPAWKDKLSDEEVLLIINWITSLWPDEIYEAWMKRN